MSTTTITTCHQNFYSIPIKDAACAMPIGGNNSAINELLLLRRLRRLLRNCDYYGLAQDQSTGDLAEYLIKASKPGEVWRNTNANATATGSVLSTEAGTVVATVSETASGSRSSVGASSMSTSGGVGVLVVLVVGVVAGLVI